MSRWTVYQFFSLLTLIACLTFIHFNITTNQILIDNNTVYLMLLFNFWISFFIYLIFLFEAKKGNSLFSHPIWGKMPIIVIIVSTLSLGLFTYFALNDSFMSLIAQSAWIIFPMFIFFYFLVFLFIFSLEYRRQSAKENSVKTVHLTFLWSTLLLVGVFIFL